MKKRIFTLTLLTIFGLFAFMQNANAQRLQLVHNAAAVAFDTLDVYIDGTLFGQDTFAFRTATGLISLPAGDHIININGRNSIDSGDLVLGRFPITLVGTQIHVGMLTGLDMPANYAANPSGRATDLQLIFKDNITVPTAANQTSVNFIQGTTDAAMMDIHSRVGSGASGKLFDNLRYNDTGYNKMVNSSTGTLLELRDSTGGNVLNPYTYELPLNVYAKKSVVVFTSGFLNTAANQGGKAFGVFLVDTNGGKARELNIPMGRVQFIHNAAAVVLDTVDVYVDGTLLVDNISFRRATKLLSVKGGFHTININEKGSTDSGSMVIARLPAMIVGTQINIAMLVGLNTQTGYAANPDGKNTDLQLILRNNVTLSPIETEISFFNGTTDMSGVDFYARPNKLFANNMFFGNSQVSTNKSEAVIMDFRDTSGLNNFNSYSLPLNLFARKSIVVFTSGFGVPSSNLYGEPVRVLMVDTNGGVATELQQITRMILVNNSPDDSLRTVDVYLDNVKVADNLAYRKAALITASTGNHDITISHSSSNANADSTMLLRVKTMSFQNGGTYLAFITGVKDTTKHVSNPDGLSTKLQLEVNNTFKEGTVSGQVLLQFHNGMLDAPQWDLDRIGTPNTKIGDNIAYRSFSSPVSVPALSTTLSVTRADSFTTIGQYAMNPTAYSGLTGCLFTSGINTPNGANPYLDKIYVVYSTGTVEELKKSIIGATQIVHNSPDVLHDTVDLYVNNVLFKKDLAFRTGLPFTTFNTTSLQIAIAPKNSVGVADAFFTKTFTTNSTKSYYLILSGVSDVSKYISNPNAKNIAFDIVEYNAAAQESRVAKNVDLLYFHGATDVQTTTCIGESQSQFLSKDDSYGAFHGYGAHSSLDNIVMLLRDAVTDSVLYTGVANLSIGQGKTGLVFLSGFSIANDTLNQNGDTLTMFVAWPDGNIDSIALVQPATGIAESLLGKVKVSVFPNPANDQFTIAMTAQKQTNLIVSIIDITGKTMYEQTKTLSSGVNNVFINTTEFQTGMYFVRLTSNGQSLTQKLSIIK